MRLALFARLAWQDYRCDARLSWCAILALAAVIAPLLVLFGLKFGLVTTLTERLERDPAVREIIPWVAPATACKASRRWPCARMSVS